MVFLIFYSDKYILTAIYQEEGTHYRPVTQPQAFPTPAPGASSTELLLVAFIPTLGF